MQARKAAGSLALGKGDDDKGAHQRIHHQHGQARRVRLVACVQGYVFYSFAL